MTNNQIIKKIELDVKEILSKYDAGHDWWHTNRVFKLANYINKFEKADSFIIQLAALLHDVADSKFNKSEEAGLLKVMKILEDNCIDKDIISKVIFIVKNISFKSENISENKKTTEFKIVQDADRLDAIGAIGIARTFVYGGFKGNEIFNPEISPSINQSKEEYKKRKSTSINHFYEKLLLLKDIMNTDTAKKIAIKRHDFMLKYLNQFFNEWNLEIDL